MSQIPNPKVALIGNPNSGKSTLFNALTGLNQKTGNLPGVTVEQKTGFTKIPQDPSIEIQTQIIDLPGTYSLYPKSADEEIAFKVLCDPANPLHPDIVVIVVDAANLKRSLLLATQIIDLKIPALLALNMVDTLKAKGCIINIELLSQKIGIPVIPLNSRKKEGVEDLKKVIGDTIKNIELKNQASEAPAFRKEWGEATPLIKDIRSVVFTHSDYSAFQVACNVDKISFFDQHPEKKKAIKFVLQKHQPNIRDLQGKETIQRYQAITVLIKEVSTYNNKISVQLSQKLDAVFTHKFYGYLVFLAILFLIFQSVFSLAQYPMDFIEGVFAKLSSFTNTHMPTGMLNNLISQGIIPGISGIVVFVPQIALLFTFIAILEDTGYMARVSFIMDKPMRKFGLNGRSIIPIISSTACAVPSIMSTRTISNWKERMITIMVAPLMSCSARLPVYILLISLVIPSKMIFGILSLQGLVMMSLYLIGFIAAMGVAWIMKHLLKSKEQSFFVMEMPDYKLPDWKTIAITIFDKVKMFVLEAGKIILAISIILWVLSSFAPNNAFEKIDEKYKAAEYASTSPNELMAKIQSEKLENSYVGILGQKIEPVIAPLGFNWKVGIALITSFAAREVFVGTMSTIYSIGKSQDQLSLQEKMREDVNPQTGKTYYTLAVGVSLLLFYVFAMQCMSTLAIVFRETKHWKWPLIQFVYMTGLAYTISFIAFHFLK